VVVGRPAPGFERAHQGAYSRRRRLPKIAKVWASATVRRTNARHEDGRPARGRYRRRRRRPDDCRRAAAGCGMAAARARAGRRGRRLQKPAPARIRAGNCRALESGRKRKRRSEPFRRRCDRSRRRRPIQGALAARVQQLGDDSSTGERATMRSRRGRFATFAKLKR